MRRVTDQEVGPAGQRQSGAGAGKRFLVLFRMIEQDQELVKKVGNNLVGNKILLTLYPKQKHYVTHTNTNQTKKSNLW